MKKMLFAFAAVLLLCYTNTLGQIHKKCYGETAAAFVSRIKPKQAKLQHVSEQAPWQNGKKTIVYFYSGSAVMPKENPGLEKQNLVGMLLTETRKNRYQQILIDSVTGYKNAAIEAVFYVNADKDPGEELAVLFSFEMDPMVSKCTGKGYETFFYKKPSLAKPLPERSKVAAAGSFYGCDCTCMRNHQETARFKTREAVMAELKRLGY